MKIKKLLLTLPVATMGAGLLATVLTSCNTSSIDDDKKVTLDDEGKLAKSFVDGKNYTYTDAVKWALTRSTSWATFKQALADEIVLKWYEDRMYEDKEGKKERNKTFKSNYDEWKYQINKDYDSTVQAEKTKYGTNYKFYLQNEYLSQYGGTEETYKHAKLVEKVKSEFTTNVFKFNYFGINNAEQKAGTEVRSAYPQYFTNDASTTVSREELNKPENWSKLGFFASLNPSFSMKEWPATFDKIDVDFLAKNPDGDYATIQEYVFNRYFNTEKPFFSAASLFKYSKPHGIEEGDKLSVIYNSSDTAIKVPDDANESFPFFGGAEPTDATKGTRMYMEWYNAFVNGDFATQYTDSTHPSNGTVSISNTSSGGKGKYSEDSQTLLLASATQMLGGTDSLYVPYATVAAQMYQNMLLGSTEVVANTKMNKTSKDYIKTTIPATVFEAVKNNNPAILKNFFFDPAQYKIFTEVNSEDKLNSFLDLTRVYPDGLTGSGTRTDPYVYHCPLFKNVKNFTYFYGNENATGDNILITNPATGHEDYFSPKSGIIYVTNTMYIDNFAPDGEKINGQPWALQLNQSGMHAQTIDGYDYIQNYASYGSKATNKVDAFKEVFKYRLMQKRTDQIDFMSGDLLGASGKLKTYFTNNFADIILELAQDAKYGNMFRTLDSFKQSDLPVETDESVYFFTKLVKDEKFDLAHIKDWIKLVAIYDNDKKNIELVEKINSYIYEYRTKVITTAKSTTLMKTIYGNGLLAPLAYNYQDSVSEGITKHDYRVCNVVADITFDNNTPSVKNRTFRSTMSTDLKAIESSTFVTESITAKVNSDEPFSPQIKAAKNVSSNRAWFKSSLVDKFMYSFYGNKNGMANKIKMDTYEAYEDAVIKNDATIKSAENWQAMLESTQMQNAIKTTYAKGKVITGNTTYAELGTKTDKFADFLKNIGSRYTLNLNYQKALNGDYADEALYEVLFEASLAYLTINNFENLYKNLNSKIGENEVALVGYVNKLNPWYETDTTYKTAVADTAGLIGRYGFNPNVDNLFDQDGFAGGSVDEKHENSKDASASYWNLVTNDTLGTDALAGFTGIQSKTNNSFDSTSGLQTAAFDKFAWSTHGTKNLVSGNTYAANEGAWFSFAGSKETNGNLITFDTITYTEGSTSSSFSAKQLQGDTTRFPEQTKITQQVLRLAKKIANYDSIDDLKTLSKSLADAYDGGSIFKLIGYGEKTYQDPNQMRIDMLNALPHFTLNADGSVKDYVPGEFEKCFNRISNVEIHTTTKVESNQDYCFEDGKGNGYHAFIKQVNKADITEKRLHYTYNETTKKWENADSPITAEEFLYILCATAAESSVQSLVVTQAIKTILKDDKLTVYDANLYNAFDSSWIKDWVKKPIGK